MAMVLLLLLLLRQRQQQQVVAWKTIWTPTWHPRSRNNDFCCNAKLDQKRNRKFSCRFFCFPRSLSLSLAVIGIEYSDTWRIVHFCLIFTESGLDTRILILLKFWYSDVACFALLCLFGLIERESEKKKTFVSCFLYPDPRALTVWNCCFPLYNI